jgi:hypothetical protein
MFNLIQRFFTKDIFNRQLIRTQFSEFFFSMPEHNWVSEGQLRSHFEDMFSVLPVGLLDVLMKKHAVTFLKSEELRTAGNVSRSHKNTIYIFPEFQKLLLTNRRSAVAYLAQELAFVLYELEESHADPLMAEVEADKFVSDLGLTFELEELLLMLDETAEKRLRLTYLTANHFSNDN